MIGSISKFIISRGVFGIDDNIEPPISKTLELAFQDRYISLQRSTRAAALQFLLKNSQQRRAPGEEETTPYYTNITEQHCSQILREYKKQNPVPAPNREVDAILGQLGSITAQVHNRIKYLR